MELPAFPIGMVMPDDFPVRKACVDPPHVDFNVWDEEKLPLFVNGTLDDLIPHTDYGVLCGAVLRLACDFFLVDPDIDILAIAGMGKSLELSFAILSQSSLLSLRRLRLMMK